jgi:hypothetical protein
MPLTHIFSFEFHNSSCSIITPLLESCRDPERSWDFHIVTLVHSTARCQFLIAVSAASKYNQLLIQPRTVTREKQTYTKIT